MQLLQQRRLPALFSIRRLQWRPRHLSLPHRQLLRRQKYLDWQVKSCSQGYGELGLDRHFESWVPSREDDPLVKHLQALVLSREEGSLVKHFEALVPNGNQDREFTISRACKFFEALASMAQGCTRKVLEIADNGSGNHMSSPSQLESSTVSAMKACSDDIRLATANYLVSQKGELDVHLPDFGLDDWLLVLNSRPPCLVRRTASGKPRP